VDEALTAHELVKVRFVDHKDDKGPLTEELASRTGSEVVTRIGHVIALWRQHPEEERRKIALPGG
jgi:RNA-binding protein